MLVCFCHRHPAIALDPTDNEGAFLVYQPMFHIYSISMMMFSFCDGKTLICLPKFDLIQYLQLVQKYKVGGFIWKGDILQRVKHNM